MTVLKNNDYSRSHLIMCPTIAQIHLSQNIEPNLKVYGYYENNVSASYKNLIASAFTVNKVCINKLHFLNQRYCKSRSNTKTRKINDLQFQKQHLLIIELKQMFLSYKQVFILQVSM